MFKTKSPVLLIILFLGLSLSAMIFLKSQKKSMNLSQFNGTLLDNPRTLPPFSLTQINHTSFDNQQLKGHWSILFFGFTNCGSLCPTTMGELAKMYRLLENQQISPKPQVIMVTIDPKRDTLEKLNQYVKVFHKDFIGARGNSESTRTLTQALGIAYTKVTRPSAQNSTYDDFEHTGALMFFNPQGELVAFTTPPHQAQALANDYHLLIQSH